MGIASGGTPCPKPEKRSTARNRRKREKRIRTAAVRQYVFARERDLCRCCRFRTAESMHELRARSLGGKISRVNSIAVCGSGTTGCHGYLQSHAITYSTTVIEGAEAAILFMPETPTAADWMRVKFGESILSQPMVQMEAE